MPILTTEFAVDLPGAYTHAKYPFPYPKIKTRAEVDSSKTAIPAKIPTITSLEHNLTYR